MIKKTYLFIVILIAFSCSGPVAQLTDHLKKDPAYIEDNADEFDRLFNQIDFTVRSLEHDELGYQILLSLNEYAIRALFNTDFYYRMNIPEVGDIADLALQKKSTLITSLYIEKAGIKNPGSFLYNKGFPLDFRLNDYTLLDFIILEEDIDFLKDLVSRGIILQIDKNFFLLLKKAETFMLMEKSGVYVVTEYAISAKNVLLDSSFLPLYKKHLSDLSVNNLNVYYESFCKDISTLILSSDFTSQSDSAASIMSLLKLFISLGIDVNTEILPDSNKGTLKGLWPLGIALMCGDTMYSEYLLNQGAVPQARDVLYALENGYFETADLLIHLGADINSEFEAFYNDDFYSGTTISNILFELIIQGKYEAVQYLLPKSRLHNSFYNGKTSYKTGGYFNSKLNLTAAAYLEDQLEIYNYLLEQSVPPVYGEAETFIDYESMLTEYFNNPDDFYMTQLDGIFHSNNADMKMYVKDKDVYVDIYWYNYAYYVENYMNSSVFVSKVKDLLKDPGPFSANESVLLNIMKKTESCRYYRWPFGTVK